ncbi:MAG: hypothetical protein XD60_0339 [Acetothermia bacterium 64_32]|nr:MAG: hypothetical protein XD60_0339 [Acetothermia bacterium 64_32]HAF71510.1 alpha-amlyase [Candidatus Acetothermia bacterium]
MRIPNWVPDAVFYQIFPDRFYNGDPSNDPPDTEPWGGIPTRENLFGGDLEGVIQKLDYIADLGANAIYLTPIFRAGSNHKYDTFDYFAIDPAFGDDTVFDRLIHEAHARGIRIVLDGVFNHCGVGFPPFQDLLRKGASSRYKDWFMPYDFPLRMKPYPNYATCGGVAYMPKLNTRNPDVEAFIHRVALYWLERGIDGWRLDMAYEIHPGFWRRFRKAVKERFPDAYLVAEEWRDPSPLLQGEAFDGATHYQLRELLLDFFVRKALSADSFARALEVLRGRLPPGAEWGMLTPLGSHDTPRLLTVCGGDPKVALLMFSFLFTYPGAPLIYYGDENGMEGGDDPDCRRPMIWEEAAWNQEIREGVRRLVRLRHKIEALRRGVFKMGYAEDRIFSFYRLGRGESVFVVLNDTPVARAATIPVLYEDGTILKDSLTGELYRVSRGCLRFDPLPPRRSLVLVAESEAAIR